MTTVDREAGLVEGIRRTCFEHPLLGDLRPLVKHYQAYIYISTQKLGTCTVHGLSNYFKTASFALLVSLICAHLAHLSALFARVA